MTVIIWLPALVLVAGVLMYALATNPKVSEMGRLMFACGLLVLLFESATRVFLTP
jgi:hypothetical protein